MDIEIQDNGNRVLFMLDYVEHPVLKSQIRDVNIVIGSTLRVDLGLGPKNCIYIDYNDVSSPELGSVQELREFILEML